MGHMPVDAKLAAEIADRIAKASSLCDSSLRTVKANETLGQVKVYGGLVSDFMGQSFTNVLGPIWKAFPTLEPTEMRVPYVEPEPTLTAESQQCVTEFLREARSALAFARSAVSAEQGNDLFGPAGLAELEAAVRAIEEFLQHPRFRNVEAKS
jgi:hypothetical protein